jgi:glycosyltransferase involved in cell wall biosynthesis
MSMAPPKIAVCLLAYNHANIIADSIRSVLAQDFADYELILSDDCSTDDTWNVIQQLAATDARIRAVRTPRNLGMAGNSNFAVAQSKAPFIALLHHDDLYRSDLLSRWLEVLERHPEAAFAANGYAIHGQSLLRIEPYAECNDGRQLLEQYLLPIWGCAFRGTAMIRRSCWESVGGMRERFGMLADVDLWMRLAARWSVGYVAEPLITVRQERPDDYPDAYTKWSWPRMRLLYEIHGTIRDELYGRSGVRNRVRWERYRLRVSRDIAYWLAYAVAKQRWDMLATSDEIANEYELPPVRWLRESLRVGANALGASDVSGHGTRD